MFAVIGFHLNNNMHNWMDESKDIFQKLPKSRHFQFQNMTEIMIATFVKEISQEQFSLGFDNLLM